ncbi:MAG: transposase [Magnetococcales bacterium]|nr:transposase [Magnetococcales bacterium]
MRNQEKKGVQHPAFQWVNTMLGNIKTSMAGTYHSFSGKHLPCYLTSFQYRLNRRFNLAAMMPRLLLCCGEDDSYTTKDVKTG